MLQTDIIKKAGYTQYKNSFRPISDRAALCVVKKDNKKYICVNEHKKELPISYVVDSFSGEGYHISIAEFTWNNYLILKEHINISPTISNLKASFGTGDRLGLVTAAHLSALKKHEIFPVISQQSPRELEKEKRTFKSVLLDAVLGLLENGYTGEFGADADHIKSKERFEEALEAKYSMYTIDVSDELNDLSQFSEDDINNPKDVVNSVSLNIIKNYSGKQMKSDEYYYEIDKTNLSESAIIFEKSMDKAVDYYNMAKEKLEDFDFEISIDEGRRETTFEDHLYCAAYLSKKEVKFTSIAPKFPGKFQKAIDYVGNIEEFKHAANIHAEITREFGEYKLSLHSGSDKFSIYNIFKEATKGVYHIKTSGTSWLRACILTALINKELFDKIYRICIDNLEENLKSYDVDIDTSDFLYELNDSINRELFITNPKVTQLLHISYGSVLDNIKDELYRFLNENEEKHYYLVSKHIEKHLI